jgi:hypothetical protein
VSGAAGGSLWDFSADSVWEKGSTSLFSPETTAVGSTHDEHVRSSSPSHRGPLSIIPALLASTLIVAGCSSGNTPGKHEPTREPGTPEAGGAGDAGGGDAAPGPQAEAKDGGSERPRVDSKPGAGADVDAGAPDRASVDGPDLSDAGGPLPDATAATCPRFTQGTATAKIASPELTEASGLAASRRLPGVLYVHNDSGDGARFFAVKTDGTYLGQFVLTGAAATDWEDMAVGPHRGGSSIYLGDIGDNAAREGASDQRASIAVYRLAEPALPPAEKFTVRTAAWEKITLTYPDKPHDSETLMIDPRTGDLYLVTKELNGQSLVYVAEAPLEAGASIMLRSVAKLHFGAAPLAGDPLATGGDISPLGDAILLRSYDTAFFWPRQAAQTVAQALAEKPIIVPLVQEEQGESIAFAADASAYFTISEGTSQSLHVFRATCASP